MTEGENPANHRIKDSVITQGMINRYAEQGCQMNIEWVSGEAPVKLAVVTGIWKMVQEVITRPGPTDARYDKA